MEELNSGPPKTNPSSGREKDLNPGPPDYKSSALPLGHVLYAICVLYFLYSLLILFFGSEWEFYFLSK